MARALALVSGRDHLLLMSRAHLLTTAALSRSHNTSFSTFRYLIVRLGGMGTLLNHYIMLAIGASTI